MRDPSWLRSSPRSPSTEVDAMVEMARSWRDADPDPTTRAELDGILARGDMDAIRDRFDGTLAFGTAGIRAELGAGPLRMNRLVVGRFAAGIAEFLSLSDPQGALGGVVIGYDGRTNSDIFASDLARVLSRAGVGVSMLPRAAPTPVLSFAVRYLHMGYGLMVTASHNPRDDNGIKVYVADGGQILPPVDREIASFIAGIDPLDLPAGWAEGPTGCRIAGDVIDAYVDALLSLASRSPLASQSPITVVYTALHGVGYELVQTVLERAGWPPVVPVIEQVRPDPMFPTTPVPNPEEPGVLGLARKTAEDCNADLVLANDPDADRLAVMVPGPGGWQTLSGDELGVLIGDAVLADLASGRWPGHESGSAPIVATTVVSASLLRRMAEAAGVRCVTTLTGFKWIVRAAGPGTHLAYGYEEALGYALYPDMVADKDGISAALLVVGLANAAARSGRSLRDRLDELALLHGLHVTRQRAIHAGGPGELTRLSLALDRIRQDPPDQLSGRRVTVTDMRQADPGVVDLAGGYAERHPGQPHAPTDILIWHLENVARVVFRPSGTEPKVKVYAEVVRSIQDPHDVAGERAQAMEDVEQLIATAASRLELDSLPGPGTPSSRGSGG